jgi:hypothetical protein
VPFVHDRRRSVVEHHLERHDVVESESCDAVERSVSAAQGQTDHSDAAVRSRRRHQAEWLRRCHDIGCGRPARDECGLRRHVDLDSPHEREVDHQSTGGQGPPSPVVATTSDGDGNAGVGRVAQCRLHLGARRRSDHGRGASRHCAVPEPGPGIERRGSGQVDSRGGDVSGGRRAVGRVSVDGHGGLS